ncbi:hypothetical protein CRUP_008342 [Coryphaenoides rupestris]|nr:hypothetical protein CRUP_008342 [Coryphaenoides rupestris]
MSYRLFEGKDHASIYQKYRFVPAEEVKNLILQYLDKKREGQPLGLAVDLGCGTGQSSRLLAPHFQEVVGLDISEGQLTEARAVQGHHNITYRYRLGMAEELPFSDGSVDLLMAASAAHWFQQERFLSEAERVLKPRGCMALLGFDDNNLRLHSRDCGDRLTCIYHEVLVANSKLQELFAAIPFPDKHRALLGFIESWSMFQTYCRTQPTAAQHLLHNTLNRILEEMGAESADTELELHMEYFCILASKPE